MKILVTAAALLMAACSGAGDGPGGPIDAGRGRADADPNQPDARPVSCSEGSAEIGGCEQSGTGDLCTGEPNEVSQFVPVETGGELGFVLGPQGFRMFPVSVRTSGIDPGDVDNPASTDRPNVTITLMRDSVEQMTRYTGRPTFLGDGGDPELQDATGVFLILDAPADELADKFFTAIAEIQDSNGEFRCGSLTFLAIQQ